MRQMLFVALMAFMTLSFNCKKNPVGPEDHPPEENLFDTTSHNWKFKTFILGDGNASCLNDVAIINDTLIYAAEDVETLDSLGNWRNPLYNVAKWNGSKWSFQSVPFQIYNYDGTIAGSYYAIAQTIYGFDESNFILTDGIDMLKWNEKSFSHYANPYNVINGMIHKIWAVSPGDFYAVGELGTIVHYKDGKWEKIEAGVKESVQEIWGEKTDSGEVKILCLSATIFDGGVENIFSIKGNTVEKLDTRGLSWSLRGLWFDSKGYYITGAEVYNKKSLQDSLWQKLEAGESQFYGFTESVRGNAWNDVVAVGDFGTLLHYNGSSWRNFTKEINLPDCVFNAVCIKGNVMAAVGYMTGGRAVVVIGKRQQITFPGNSFLLVIH